jgi:hypothetical protein
MSYQTYNELKGFISRNCYEIVKVRQNGSIIDDSNKYLGKFLYFTPLRAVFQGNSEGITLPHQIDDSIRYREVDCRYNDYEIEQRIKEEMSRMRGDIPLNDSDEDDDDDGYIPPNQAPPPLLAPQPQQSYGYPLNRVNKYMEKYMKYKIKYLNLKKNL